MCSASSTLWDLPEEQDLPDESDEPQHATAAFVITAAALETDAVLDRMGGDATAWRRWHAAREQWPGSGSMDSSGLGTSYSEIDWSDVETADVDPIGLPIRRSGVSGIMDQIHLIEADREADLETDLIGRASGFVGGRVGAPDDEVQEPPAGPKTLGWLTAHAGPARSDGAHKMETPTTDSALSGAPMSSFDTALALACEMSPGCADEPVAGTEKVVIIPLCDTPKPLARTCPDPSSPITPAATRNQKRARFGPPPPRFSALLTEAPAKGPPELAVRPAGQQPVASPVQARLSETESDDKERLSPGDSAKAWWSSAHCGSCSRCRSAKSEHAEQMEWMTPLISACIDGRVGCVQELLQSPEADVDFADVDGHTALHAACAFGYADCVRMLIQAGASLSLPDHEGATALDGARMSGSDAGEACVSMMMDAGAKDAQVFAEHEATTVMHSIEVPVDQP